MDDLGTVCKPNLSNNLKHGSELKVRHHSVRNFSDFGPVSRDGMLLKHRRRFID